MTMKKLLVAFGLIFLQATGVAQEVKTQAPPEAYRAQAAFAVFNCSLAMRVFISTGKADDMEDYKKCVADAKPKVKSAYDAALKEVKAPQAKDALKGYHVAFLTALDSTNLDASETRSSFDQKQRAMTTKLNEAWARFEVER